MAKESQTTLKWKAQFEMLVKVVDKSRDNCNLVFKKHMLELRHQVLESRSENYNLKKEVHGAQMIYLYLSQLLV